MIAEQYKAMLQGKSVIRQLAEWSTARGAEIGYENVFDYSLGNPSVPCPAHFTEVCQRLLAEKEPVALHGYSPTLTLPAVRAAVADSLNRRFGMHYTKDHIFMTSGAAGALAHALRCVAVPGQKILTFAPFFPEYKPYVEGAGLTLSVVPPRCEDFQIDFAAAESLLDETTAAVLINTPNNPSGVVYSRQTLETLAAILRAKEALYGHPIYLISDEPYREIAFHGVEVPWVPQIYKDTVVCYSFSKSLSLPGERLGYVLVPKQVTDADSVYAATAGAGRSQGYVNAPSLFQRVAAECCDLTADISVYERNCALLTDALREMGYQVVQPGGAFYLFPRSLEPDDMAFSKRAKKFDLLLVPGSGFGAPGHFRIAYCVQTEMIERALPRFKALADSYQ